MQTARLRTDRVLIVGGGIAALYAGLAVIILVVGAVVWFGAWYYPAMGLAGIPKDGYRQAMELAARGMAASEGLAYEDFDFLKFRQVERGGESLILSRARSWRR